MEASSADRELFASAGAPSSDRLAKPWWLVLSVVVRNLRPVLLRNVVMDGCDGVGLADVARGAFGVTLDETAARGLPVNDRAQKDQSKK